MMLKPIVHTTSAFAYSIEHTIGLLTHHIQLNTRNRNFSGKTLNLHIHLNVSTHSYIYLLCITEGSKKGEVITEGRTGRAGRTEGGTNLGGHEYRHGVAKHGLHCILMGGDTTSFPPGQCFSLSTWLVVVVTILLLIQFT